MDGEKRLGKFFLIIFIALLVRLPLLDSPFQNIHAGNEAFYSSIAANILEGKYQTSYRGLEPSAPPLLPIILSISFRFFGVCELAARLPLLVFALMSVVLFSLIVLEKHGPDVALWSGLFAALVPGVVYYSRNVQTEGLFFYLVLSSAYFCIRKQQGWCWSSFALALLAKNTAILGLPLLLYLGGKDTKKHYVALSLVPVILFSASAYLGSPGYASWYYLRGENCSWFTGVALELVNLVVDLTPVGVMILICGTVDLFMDKKKEYLWLIPAVVPWFVLLFTHTCAWIGNNYYHYPALYFLCVVMGTWFNNFSKKRKVDGIVLMCLFILTCLYFLSMIYTTQMSSPLIWRP